MTFLLAYCAAPSSMNNFVVRINVILISVALSLGIGIDSEKKYH